MEKQVIKIARRTVPYKCKRCNRMVDINYATPKTTETETVILHGWDYKHSHKQVFDIQRINDKDIYFPINDD